VTCIAGGFVPEKVFWIQIILFLVGKMAITSAFTIVYVYSGELKKIFDFDDQITYLVLQQLRCSQLSSEAAVSEHSQHFHASELYLRHLCHCSNVSTISCPFWYLEFSLSYLDFWQQLFLKRLEKNYLTQLRKLRT
jgi:hypothetical protein